MYHTYVLQYWVVLGRDCYSWHIQIIYFSPYDALADVAEKKVQWRSDFQSGSRLVMWKMQNVWAQNVQHNWSVLNVSEFDKTFNYTLWFCILKSQKSLQNIPQITPDHIRSSQNLALGTYFLHCPPPLPKPRGNPPYFKRPYNRRFSLQKWKKHTIGHN